MQTREPRLFGQRFDRRQQLADHAVGHRDDIAVAVIRQHLRVNARDYQRHIRLHGEQTAGVDHQAAHVAGLFGIASGSVAGGDEEGQLGLRPVELFGVLHQKRLAVEAHIGARTAFACQRIEQRDIPAVRHRVFSRVFHS